MPAWCRVTVKHTLSPFVLWSNTNIAPTPWDIAGGGFIWLPLLIQLAKKMPPWCHLLHQVLPLRVGRALFWRRSWVFSFGSMTRAGRLRRLNTTTPSGPTQLPPPPARRRLLCCAPSISAETSIIGDNEDHRLLQRGSEWLGASSFVGWETIATCCVAQGQS